MYYFISVNYGTSYVIKDWIDSIDKCFKEEKKIIIIDNFKTITERKYIKELSNKLNFYLIESENIGYGAALNKGIEFVKNTYFNGIVFAGNLDLIYKNIPRLESKNYVYIPKVLEGKRDRNPFLTKLQRKFVSIYKIAGKSNCKYIYYIIVLINKCIGWIPSKTWAIHGALFCFDLSLVKENIFNNDSFLYGEELEFASYMEEKKAKLLNTNIIVQHNSHVATKDINKSTKDFLALWWPSYRNWDKRWN